MPAKCPPGMIRRNAYTRKGYTRLDGTKVKSTYVKSGCVKDTGKPGKTAAKNKVLPKPVKGNLSKFGYFDVKNTSAAVRRAALLKGVEADGYDTIVARVNLVANYNKTSDPVAHKIMRSDIAWMQKNLKPIYSKTALRKASSRRSSKKTSKKAAKKTSRRGSKKTSKKAAKKTSRKGSKKAAKKTSRRGSKKAAKKTSRRGSKKAAKKTSRRASKKTAKKTSKKGLVKAGTKKVGGRSRQLYHVSGSTKKFYRYRKKDGTYGRRYI